MNIRKLIQLFHQDHTAYLDYVAGIESSICFMRSALEAAQSNEEIRLLQPKYVQIMENQIKRLEPFHLHNVEATRVLQKNHYDPRHQPKGFYNGPQREAAILAHFLLLEATSADGENPSLPLKDYAETVPNEHQKIIAKAITQLYDKAGLKGTKGGDRKHQELEKALLTDADGGQFLKSLKALVSAEVEATRTESAWEKYQKAEALKAKKKKETLKNLGVKDLEGFLASAP